MTLVKLACFEGQRIRYFFAEKVGPDVYRKALEKQTSEDKVWFLIIRKQS